MARPLRIQAAGLTYHVTARGAGRMPIYLDDRDREMFLGLLARVVAQQRIECHAFCLMPNHYHQVVTTLEANLSRAIKQLNGIYGQWWSRRHKRPGHVFQGRFHAQVVQSETYLLTACRYDVLNPVRAHLVDRPEEWRWSSYRATAGLAPVPPFVHLDVLWQALGASDVGSAVRKYREFVIEPLAGKRLPAAPILGDPEFIAHFEGWRRKASREVPSRERRIRPLLTDVFAGPSSRGWRNTRIVDAYRLGYTAREIAEYVGLHRTRVARIVDEVMRRNGAREPTPHGPERAPEPVGAQRVESAPDPS